MSKNRYLSLLLVITGAIGMLAASMLIVERINVLSDPTYVPMCNIGEALNCGNVMATDQAKVFGFPNAIIGIVGFAVVLTIGMAELAGARFAGWFWGGLQVGVTFAILFIHWLMYQTLYEIPLPLLNRAGKANVPIQHVVACGDRAEHGCKRNQPYRDSDQPSIGC